MKRIIKPFNISEEGFLSHFDVETRSGYPVVIESSNPVSFRPSIISKMYKDGKKITLITGIDGKFSNEDCSDLDLVLVNYEFNPGEIICSKFGTLIYRGIADTIKQAVLTDCYLYHKTKELVVESSPKIGWGGVNEFRTANKNQISTFLKALAKKGLEYNLITKKLKVKTYFDLQCFDKVLARNDVSEDWIATIFSHYKYGKEIHYICAGLEYSQCIPYKGNEQLCQKHTN